MYGFEWVMLLLLEFAHCYNVSLSPLMEILLILLIVILLAVPWLFLFFLFLVFSIILGLELGCEYRR